MGTNKSRMRSSPELSVLWSVNMWKHCEMKLQENINFHRSYPP